MIRDKKINIDHNRKLACHPKKKNMLQGEINNFTVIRPNKCESTQLYSTSFLSAADEEGELVSYFIVPGFRNHLS